VARTGSPGKTNSRAAEKLLTRNAPISTLIHVECLAFKTHFVFLLYRPLELVYSLVPWRKVRFALKDWGMSRHESLPRTVTIDHNYYIWNGYFLKVRFTCTTSGCFVHPPYFFKKSKDFVFSNRYSGSVLFVRQFFVGEFRERIFSSTHIDS
jgi:hypothetical protein